MWERRPGAIEQSPRGRGSYKFKRGLRSEE